HLRADRGQGDFGDRPAPLEARSSSDTGGGLMRIVIAGAGRGGLNLAVHLQRSGNSVAIVDRDPAVAHRAFEQSGTAAFSGDATDVAVLKQAEPARADVVIAM